MNRFLGEEKYWKLVRLEEAVRLADERDAAIARAEQAISAYADAVALINRWIFLKDQGRIVLLADMETQRDRLLDMHKEAWK